MKPETLRFGEKELRWVEVMDAYVLELSEDLYLLVQSDDNGVHWYPKLQWDLDDAHDPQYIADELQKVMTKVFFSLESVLINKDCPRCGAENSLFSGYTCGSCASDV